MYPLGALIHLLPDGFQFPPIISVGLASIWIMGMPQHMINTFSIFQDGRYLYNYPRGVNKYNKMKNILKLV